MFSSVSSHKAPGMSLASQLPQHVPGGQVSSPSGDTLPRFHSCFS